MFFNILLTVSVCLFLIFYVGYYRILKTAAEANPQLGIGGYAISALIFGFISATSDEFHNSLREAMIKDSHKIKE